MTDLVEVGRDVETGVVYLLDPHVLTAIICTVAAACIAGALVIWLAVELEMWRKK